MKKIAIVLGCNIHWAPYYYRYEKILKNNNIDFDVILWNREGIDEKIDAKKIEFKVSDISCNKNPFKVLKFFLFANFVKNIIKTKNYSKIIFLGFQGCALTLNANFFINNFKNLYWLDIRDYHYEWFKPYYKLEEKVINSAFDVTISSPGFKKFLPFYNYNYLYNIDPNMNDVILKYNRKPDIRDCIRISFIGNVRYFKENSLLLKSLGNDKRFRLQYFGTGTTTLEDYCIRNRIDNVEFYGQFPQSETVYFYNKTDIINNIYGNQTMEVTTALSNKLYYSICLKLPILVSPKTYMDNFCKQYGFAFVYNAGLDFSDRLYNWYHSFIRKNNDKMFSDAWNCIQKDENRTLNRLYEFINS